MLFGTFLSGEISIIIRIASVSLVRSIQMVSFQFSSPREIFAFKTSKSWIKINLYRFLVEWNCAFAGNSPILSHAQWTFEKSPLCSIVTIAWNSVAVSVCGFSLSQSESFFPFSRSFFFFSETVKDVIALLLRIEFRKKMRIQFAFYHTQWTTFHRSTSK